MTILKLMVQLSPHLNECHQVRTPLVTQTSYERCVLSFLSQWPMLTGGEWAAAKNETPLVLCSTAVFG